MSTICGKHIAIVRMAAVLLLVPGFVSSLGVPSETWTTIEPAGCHASALPRGTDRAQAAATEVLYDSLCIRDQGDSFYGKHWNYCGGGGVYGKTYDAQSADDFVITGDYFITSVTADFLTELGVCPAEVCIAFHNDFDGNCVAAEQPAFFARVFQEGIECEPFEDIWNDYEGVRISASMNAPAFLTSSVWFASVQPSSEDFGGQLVVTERQSCMDFQLSCDANYRDGGEANICCDGAGVWGTYEWENYEGIFLDVDLSMRIEGILAGDCVNAQHVSARCKPRGGGGEFSTVVKVRDGQPNGIVTALLDPPDSRSISIALDGSGRGKGKFKRVPVGDHRVFVCDAVLDVRCEP